MMRLVLLGGPGAGKGTQALRLAKRLGIAHISTGDMLRAAIAAETDLGLNAKKIMDQGMLVSDDIIIALVVDRLKASDCHNGFLLDGFPRTLRQAEGLKSAEVYLDHVIEMVVSDEDIVQRISGRRVHVSSGRVYHVTAFPPQNAGFDDVTGEPLLQREDDCETIVRKRLDVYHKQTEPLVAYYKSCSQQSGAHVPQFHRVDATGTVEAIFQRILQALGIVEYV